MFYLGIDLHSKQLTVSLREETGHVVQRRQVSTEPDKIRRFCKSCSSVVRPTGGLWRS